MPTTTPPGRSASRHRAGRALPPTGGSGRPAPPPRAGRVSGVAAWPLALALALAAAGCADWRSPSETIFVWLPGEPAAAEEIHHVSRGSATPLVEAAYGPRTLVSLPGPAPGAQPVRARVPSIGTVAPFIALGVDGGGALQVPGTAHEAGWYRKAPRPGEPGPAVLAGHVQLGREAGVFAELRHVEPGDVVHVDYDDDTTFSFVVYAREQHPKAAFPTTRVYGDTPGSELRVITCGGELDPSTRHHVDNVILYADLVARTRR